MSRQSGMMCEWTNQWWERWPNVWTEYHAWVCIFLPPQPRSCVNKGPNCLETLSQLSQNCILPGKNAQVRSPAPLLGGDYFLWCKDMMVLLLGYINPGHPLDLGKAGLDTRLFTPTPCTKDFSGMWGDRSHGRTWLGLLGCTQSGHFQSCPTLTMILPPHLSSYNVNSLAICTVNAFAAKVMIVTVMLNLL